MPRFKNDVTYVLPASGFDLTLTTGKMVTMMMKGGQGDDNADSRDGSDKDKDKVQGSDKDKSVDKGSNQGNVGSSHDLLYGCALAMTWTWAMRRRREGSGVYDGFSNKSMTPTPTHLIYSRILPSQTLD